MKKRLIILSDLWGEKKATWLNNYKEALKNEFEVVFYDCCDLAEVDITIYKEENLHKQFVNGGIERAVVRLLELEKEKRIVILAFSIGGVIAWKFAKEHTKVELLYCVSSTRLRYESEKPSCNTVLYYAYNDRFKPDNNWFNQINLPALIVEGNHEVYVNKNFSKFICKDIIGTIIG